MYDIEKLYQAKDIGDAIRALKEDPEAVVISGGSDVLIKIREGRLAGCSLVSIHGIKELEGVRMEEDGTIVIGPATTFSHVTNNRIIQKYIPILGDAVDQAGGPQLRNIGTVGGNVCNGVTSADSASSLCCLDAILVVEGPEGVREIPIREWYTGPGKTVRKHDEILTAIKIKKESYEGFGGHYIKYGKRNAMEIATMGCAVTVKLTGDKKHIEEIHIGYGVAAPTPIRCFKAEEKVKGMEIGNELFETLGKSVLEEVNPRTSWRASKEFRLQLIEEMAKRALKQAIINAGVSAMLKIVHMIVNDKEVEVAVDDRESLLETLRNRLGLTSVKKGCEVGECGACTVLVDGEAIDSCIYLTMWAEGRRIMTVEGLKGPNGELSPIQKAFVEEAAVQCGFCTPGLIMTAVEIVGTGKRYNREELRKMISGHLCRCTGYENILNAMERIVEETYKVVGKED